jgi:hypothetical protein
MIFVTTTTFTAAAQMIQTRFWPDFTIGYNSGNFPQALRGGLSSSAIILLVTAYTVILANAIAKWVAPNRSITNQSGNRT